MNIAKFSVAFGLVLVVFGAMIAGAEPVDLSQYPAGTTLTVGTDGSYIIHVPGGTTGSVPVEPKVPSGSSTEGKVSFGVKDLPQDGEQVATAEETAQKYGYVGKTQPKSAPAPWPVAQTYASQPQVVYVNPPADRVSTTRSSNLDTFVQGSGFANGNSPDANRTGLKLVDLNNEAVRQDQNHIEEMTEIAVRHQDNRSEHAGRALSTVLNFFEEKEEAKEDKERRKDDAEEERREDLLEGLEDLSDEAQEWSIIRNKNKNR